MKMNIRILLPFLCFLSPLHSVIIVVHGSFAINSAWYMPGGDFYDELEKSAAHLGERVVPFMWSGELGSSAKVKAAGVLARLILSYPKYEQIILIGHSHGGNVINLATQLVYYALEEQKVRANGDQETPVPDFTVFANEFVQSEEEDTQTEVRATQSLSHRAISPLPNLLAELNQEFETIKIFAQFAHQAKGLPFETTLNTTSETVDKAPEKPYYIETVYLLATPVYAKKYSPQMRIIRRTLNLYSRGDMIQKIGGLYSRKYPVKDRLVNLRVLFKESRSSSTYNPGHTQLHDPLVAKWLLMIPDGLNEQKLGNFEQFCESKNGRIVFKENALPTYETSSKSISASVDDEIDSNDNDD